MPNVNFFRERGREGEKKRNINVQDKHQSVTSHMPQLGTWPVTQACTLTRNWTGNLSVCRPELNPLSHTSQGSKLFLKVLDSQYFRSVGHSHCYKYSIQSLWHKISCKHYLNNRYDCVPTKQKPLATACKPVLEHRKPTWELFLLLSQTTSTTLRLSDWSPGTSASMGHNILTPHLFPLRMDYLCL